MLQALKFLNFLLTVSGLNPPKKESKIFPYNFVTVFIFVLLTVLISLTMKSAIIMIPLVPVYGILQFYLATTGFMMVLIMVVLIQNRKNLVNLVASIKNVYDFEEEIWEDENKIFYEKFSFRLLVFNSVSIGALLTTYVLMFENLVDQRLVEVNTNVLGRRNPERVIGFLPWVPFDYTVSPYFEICRVCVYATMTVLSPVAMLRLSLLPTLILQVIGQFESISTRISEITSNPGFGTIDDDDVKEVIKLHQQILLISKNLVEFFRPIILLKAIFSFWMFAVLMVVITEEPIGSSIFINCAFCLLCSGYELLLDCWSGEQLARKSEKVGVAAYQCQWDRMSNSARKNLVLLTLRAQRPIQLDVRPYLIPMSLKTYVQIMKASFSCYTLLLSIKAEKH